MAQFEPFYLAQTNRNQWHKSIRNSQFYYTSAIQGVFDNDEDSYFQKYVDRIISKKQWKKEVWLWSEKKNRFPEIDMLLNLCFKKDADLKEKKFDRLRELDPYYEWLLDMEEFDYDKFEPEWVTEYKNLLFQKV